MESHDDGSSHSSLPCTVLNLRIATSEASQYLGYWQHSEDVCVSGTLFRTPVVQYITLGYWCSLSRCCDLKPLRHYFALYEPPNSCILDDRSRFLHQRYTVEHFFKKRDKYGHVLVCVRICRHRRTLRLPQTLPWSTALLRKSVEFPETRGPSAQLIQNSYESHNTLNSTNFVW